MPDVLILILILALIWTEITYRRLKSFSALLLLLLILSTPAIGSFEPSLTALLPFSLVSILWIAYNRVSLAHIRKLLLTAIIIICTLAVAYANGLINSSLQLDQERFFFIDSHFSATISRFQTWSTYLPFRFRPIFFNSWVYLPSVLGRTLSWFWLDKIVVTTGWLALIPITMGSIRTIARHDFAPLLIIFAAAAVGSLARNPNTSASYFIVLPQLITLTALGI